MQILNLSYYLEIAMSESCLQKDIWNVSHTCVFFFFFFFIWNILLLLESHSFVVASWLPSLFLPPFCGGLLPHAHKAISFHLRSEYRISFIKNFFDKAFCRVELKKPKMCIWFCDLDIKTYTALLYLIWEWHSLLFELIKLFGGRRNYL